MFPTSPLLTVSPRRLFTVGAAVLLTILAAGCDPGPPPHSDVEDFVAPEILPPELIDRPAVRVNPQALPDGATATYPASDGDPFFVSLPAREVATLDAAEVADTVVAPVLEAIGFEPGLAALESSTESGVSFPRGSFQPLADEMIAEASTNREAQSPRTQEMLEVFAGAPSTPEVDKALETGEGVTFAQFVAGIEREEIAYPFLQVHGGVPIEHTSVVATRWEGQSITSVYGSVVSNFSVANAVALSESDAERDAPQALTSLDGVDCLDDVERRRFHARRAAVDDDSSRPLPECGVVEDGPALVLLATGRDSAGDVELRHAYRMIVRMGYQAPIGVLMPAPFQLWLDAETGSLLKVLPLVHNVNGRGEVYTRDPGVGTAVRGFEVDAAASGLYDLELASTIDRIDFQADGYNASDVSISDSSGGSSSTLANFDQAPHNNEAQALCGSGTNKAFQQINVFGKLHHYTERGRALGVFTPFPRTGDFIVDVEDGSFCNAFNSGDFVSFGACQGYFSASCPNLTGTALTDRRMNPAHDNTVAAHEHAHSLTPRFTNARPTDWCGMPTCNVPTGWSAFHDLADIWADHFESTNCTAGWYAKNQGGVDNSLNCANSSEGGAFPRQHVVETPFDSTDPHDHFPEHRTLATGPYAEMQMPTAAVWQVRAGMRSKCRWSGVPQFGVRFARALRRTGFFGISAPGTNDQGLYRYLYDLEQMMMDEWATAGSPGGPPAFRHNGAHTANKVAAGFARTGLFLIPNQCLDSSAATTDATACSGGTNGGDAVIDIDDNDTADDYQIHGVPSAEVDFLELGGASPTFHVWTGPRYQFNASGAATFPNPSLCNAEFRVEVSTDVGFAPASTVTSAWTAVDRDPTTAASTECYGTWQPSASEWTTLQAGGDGSRLYYRASTRDSVGGNVRTSTSPGAGIWTVPPPYAVITSDGRSDY